jgi:ATP-binding cassette, subfamily B, bacterial
MSPAARMLRPHVARRWKALAGAGGATGALTLADLAKPWPLALLVDRLLDRQAPFTLDAADVRVLVALAAAVLVIAVVEAMAQYASDMWLQAAGERIAHDLRLRVYDHLQRLSLGFHQRRQKGDLVTRVTGDVNAMGDLFAQSLGAVVQSALLAFGMTIVLLVIDPVLALVSVVTAPLTIVLSYVYRHRVRARARERRAHEGAIASVANEALSAMTVVKAFGSEDYESRRVREGSERRLAAGVAVARLQARFDGLVGTVRAVSTAAVLVVGAVRVSHGAISPGELLVFASYTRKAQSPMRSFARELTKIAAAMAKADRLAELLASEEVLAEPADAYAEGRAAGDVALEDVVFAYGGDRPALAGVTLRVPRGERVALTGPSGAGKSTLGALVARLFDPVQGRVLIDGRDVRECSLTWLREQVALVLQDTVLFSGTVHENIAYSTAATREQVEAAARAAAADGFIRALPAGYDTDLGPQGVALSGGQRQRIGIARTLLRDPPILVLDEPTTGLDRASEDAVLAGLEALMRGRTTLLITHSERLARTADRVVKLEGGRLAPVAHPAAEPAGGRPAPAAPATAEPPALPLAPLLDAATMRALLERALGDGRRLGDVSVGRVAYKPGESVAVHYRAEVDGSARDAVATRIAGVDLAERVGRRGYARLAAKARPRAVAPPWFDEELGVLVTWLPFDPKLPALAEAPDELGRRLGIDVPREPALVGYKPRARAVLRANGHVLKAYGAPRQFDAALAGLRAASAGPLETGALAGADPELRLVAQRALAGRRPDSAHEVTAVAGALAAELARARLEGLPVAPPERHLRGAVRKGALIADVLPELRPRVEALLDRLARERPGDLPAAPAHGDFHVDQLLVSDRVAVVDFDQMCLAAPALDVATYAADVVRGREGDLAAVGDVLEAFLSGYGPPPAALDWHLAVAILGRAAHPFHRQLPNWPDRVEAMLRAAEHARA